jgi:hypothetical protein
MTWRRFLGVRHQADQWPSTHERARVRAAERLDSPLDPDEQAWLDAHLVTCGECAAIAAEYETQRTELKVLKGAEPGPPRDLWARTAAAIELEDARERSGGGRRRAGRPAGLPVGAISGVLVVAVVVGLSVLSQPGPFVPSAPPATAAASARAESPGPTPIVSAAGEVGWLAVGKSGDADVLSATIDEVCPEARNDCAPIDGSSTRKLKLDQPLTVVRSPAQGELIVVDRPAGGTGETIFAVPAPTPTARPSGSPSSSASATAVPTPTQTPTPSVEATPTPTSSLPAASESPPTPSGSSASPTLPPSLPVDGAVAIARNVVLVGDSAAYSPDGRWFAFSARPADGSAGPDVYVWRSGQEAARPVTGDHRTVFASWLGDRILASRAVQGDGTPLDEPTSPSEPGASAEPTPSDGEPATSADPDASDEAAASNDPDRADDLTSQMLTIDPETGAELPVGRGAWRPTVRPGEDAALFWDGTLELDADGVVVRPSKGRLVIGSWPVDRDGRQPQVVEPDPIGDWDARWDTTGTRLAIWVADDAEVDVGRLSLFVVDRETGRLDRGLRPLVDVPARRGFSLGERRLAWVTPAGQDGEGSRIQVLAWKDDGFGKVETLPGDASIVVIR